MADAKRMGLTVLIVFFTTLNLVTAFNIDTKFPYIYKDPTAGSENSYFGYSLAFHKATKSLLVGAPLSNAANPDKWGAVFKCNTETSKAKTCERLTRVDNVVATFNEIKKNQWMGAQVYSNNKDILACAPRYSIGATSSAKQYLYGKCENIDLASPSADYVWNPCSEISSRFKEFNYCQAGFSAKLFGGKNKQVMSGVPNIQLNTGRIALTHKDHTGTAYTSLHGLNISDYSYMGYAVTSGKFSKDKRDVIAVGGAPRASLLRGKVILYDLAVKNFPVFSNYINDPSEPEQTGTYFGSALASADIDEDGFSDLIVGAPYYSGSTPNEGAVYIYMNDKNDGLMLKQTLYGDKQTGALFGLAIASVGDLNNDVHADIAVGAPFGGASGKGVVYLYYGTANAQEPLLLKQKIEPSSIGGGSPGLSGFGFSFAEYYPYKMEGDLPRTVLNDVDVNSYPDLAIGSFKSSEVILLRSRPVATVVGGLQLGPITRIDLFNKENMCKLGTESYKCLKEVKVCFVVAGTNIGTKQSIEYTLVIDSEQVASKRGFVVDSKSARVGSLTSTKNVDILSADNCVSHQVYFKNNTRDVFRELVIQLIWKYTEPKNCTDNLCPIQNAMLPSTTQKRVFFIEDCGSDAVCSPDLVISMKYRLSGGTNTIQAGLTKIVYVDVEIKNKKENSFANKLEIVYPNDLSPNSIVIKDYPGTPVWDPNISQDRDKNTVSVTLSSPILSGKTERIEVHFGLNNVATKSITLVGKAVTESSEVNWPDNTASVTIDVALVANLTVTGNVLPESATWKKGMTSLQAVGPDVIHTFFFQNPGPSSADTSKITISFPEKYKNNYILNIMNIYFDSTSTLGNIVKCDYGGPINPLKLPVGASKPTTTNTGLNKTTKSRKRRATPVVVPELNCGSSDLTCRTIVCDLKMLKKSESVTIRINSKLVEATFDEHIKESRKITVKAVFVSASVDRPENLPPSTINVDIAINSPYLKKITGSDTIAWWIILLCVLAAIIIIGLIVFVMYKKGFFKRNKHKGDEGEPGEEDELRPGECNK